jgi:Integrase core domain
MATSSGYPTGLKRLILPLPSRTASTQRTPSGALIALLRSAVEDSTLPQAAPLILSIFFDRSMVGAEYLHLAIDDHSRLAYSEILPDEKRASCLRFLFNALRFFRSVCVKVERVMTGNGSSF